jgi:2,3-bisphosphoglycerate-dependent phosphoglycerate mutase
MFTLLIKYKEEDIMNTNIYFVRHAASTYTPEEIIRPLSDKGIEDAKRVTELLSKEDITHVISSPYKRARQTIEGIAGHFGLNIITEEDFRERRLADNPVDNFEEAIVKVWESFNFSFPGGETGNAAQDRGVLALKNILNKYSGGNIVIGTHGNIMALIMNFYDKRYNYEFWKSLNMPDIYKLSFYNEKLEEVKQIWT